MKTRLIVGTLLIIIGLLALYDVTAAVLAVMAVAAVAAIPLLFVVAFYLVAWGFEGLAGRR